jgi:beta-glucanase (GH16 family)
MWLVAAGVVLVLLIGTGVGAAVWLRPAEPARESVGAATVAASPAPSDDSALQPGNLASASASHAPAPTSSKSAAAPVDGSLIASDTFDAPGNPDSTRWDAYQSTAANGSVWSPDQVRVKDGELQIVGKGTNPTGAGNLSGGLCWCGKDGNQTYGKWQVRAKFDAGSGYGQIMGLWPISDKSIDGHITLFSVIMPDRRSSNGFVDSGTTPAVQVPVHGDFTAWHTFTLEWRETFVRMSVDSTVFYDSAKVIGPVAISHLPMHFYLQQPAGPRDGVPPANAQTPAEVISHVDWIRVYH